MQKFTLIENARDSLEHAIDHIVSTEISNVNNYKRIILDLSHVAELLFKEKLRNIHPAFVFSNVDKYPVANAHTVSAEVALARLKTIGGVEFEDSDSSALKVIRDKRNEIEHFEFKINDKEAQIVIGNVLCFIFRFSCDELNLDWANERLTNPKWAKLIKYTEFYKAQLAHISKTIEGSGIYVIDCPTCRNETFDVEAEVCLLCGHKEDVLLCRVCKNSYLFSTVEYGEEAGLCPKCEYEDGYAAANHEKY